MLGAFVAVERSSGSPPEEGAKEGGRRVVAKRDLTAGAVVFSRDDLRPVASTSTLFGEAAQKSPDRCANCFRSATDPGTARFEAAMTALGMDKPQKGKKRGGKNTKGAGGVAGKQEARTVSELVAESLGLSLSTAQALSQKTGQLLNATPRALALCGGCRTAGYCGRLCQRVAWSGKALSSAQVQDALSEEVGGALAEELALSPLLDDPAHKILCKSLKELKHSLPGNVLLAVRFWLACGYGSAEERVQPSALRDAIELLESHWEQRTEAERENYRKNARSVVQAIRGNVEGAEEMAKLMARLNCNSFGLVTLAGGVDVASIFDPAAALFNHSCSPNCIVMFTDQMDDQGTRFKSMSIRALRDVASGEELTISYIDILDPSAVRKEKLQTNYFFECSCNRCQSTPENDLHDQELVGFQCPACVAAKRPPSLLVPSQNDGEAGRMCCSLTSGACDPVLLKDLEADREAVVKLYDAGVAAAEGTGDAKAALDHLTQAYRKASALLMPRARLVQDIRVKYASLLVVLDSFMEAVPLLNECADFVRWAAGDTNVHRTVLYTEFLAIECCLVGLVAGGRKPGVPTLLRRLLVELLPRAAKDFAIGYGQTHIVTLLVRRVAEYYGVAI